MSDAGRAYVEKHSPYTGVNFLIHLRLGNIENDTYNHRLFIADENLAKLCRCSVKSVQRAKEQMVKDGFLRKLKSATGRRTAEYEFLFPKTNTTVVMEPVEVDDEGGQDVQPNEDGIGGHLVPIGGHPVLIGGHLVPETDTPPLYRNKDKKSRNKNSLSPENSDDAEAQNSGSEALLGFPNLGKAKFGKALEMANLLADLIYENDQRLSRKRPKVLQEWVEAIEKLHRIDKYDYEDIERIIRWCQQDAFWHSNVLSGRKLREKFPTLYARSGEKSKSKDTYSDIETFLQNGFDE